MKTYSYFFIFLALALFTACEKSPGLEEIYRGELSVIEKELSAIGVFELKPTTPASTTPISEHFEPAVYRYDDNDGKYGWYIPRIMQNNYAGFEKVTAIPPSRTDAIWPGNLIQGKSIFDGNLAPIPVSTKRRPGRIYLDVVSGQDSMTYYKDVKSFSGADVTQAMNEILAPYTSGFPADVSYIQQKVNSVEQMAYFLDMDKNEFLEKSGGIFNEVQWTTTKNRIMVKLEQAYFRMTYDFTGLHEVFNEYITWNDLQPYTSKDNPMCYISSVDYGRYFVLLYESESSVEKMSAALAKVYDKDNKEVLTPDDRTVFSRSNVRLFMVGGDAQSGLETITGDPEKIRAFVVNGAKFSKDNVGAPIRYSLKYLYNSLPAPTYKGIDVNITDVEYVREAKKNDVEITIKAVHNSALWLVGGSYRAISNESYYSMSPITVTVKDGNSVVREMSFNPNLPKVGAVATTNYYYNYVFQTGELGINTTKKIILTFDLYYFTKRYGGGSSSEGKTFKKRVEYTFNPVKEKWEITYSDRPNNSFQSVVISEGFNFCGLYFTLDYSFKANRETYY